MKPQPIGTQPSFGVYKATKVTRYGERSTGVINGYKLDIYTAKKGEKLRHKLYYLTDGFGRWIKSKLVYFSDNKKYKTIRSERK